ncbi:MAG: hypothetical protein JST00_30115 [Deltaproteobacteria bacterium]|nr:hypothetical protein [Deltaproteobacteria bacterium]
MRSVLPLVALAAVGCSSQVGPAEEVTPTTAAAVIVVSRSTGPGDAARIRDEATNDSSLARSSIVARFVRVRQGAPLDEAALRLAGVANDLPSPGTCRASADEKSALQGREIDLLDVGPMSVDGTILLPRQMPDPTGIVSGVFYSARAAEPFTPATRIQVRASGGQALPEGFVVNVATPKDLGDVRVASSASGLDVSWDATDDATDTVYMDVLDRASRVVTRCGSFDAGRFVVPSESLASADEGQVVIHRVHTEAFTAKGIAPGQVRFDLARVVTFRR